MTDGCGARAAQPCAAQPVGPAQPAAARDTCGTRPFSSAECLNTVATMLTEAQRRVQALEASAASKHMERTMRAGRPRPGEEAPRGARCGHIDEGNDDKEVAARFQRTVRDDIKHRNRRRGRAGQHGDDEHEHGDDDDDAPPQGTDRASRCILLRALASGFCETRVVRCPVDYYDWTLERRRVYLGAPTTLHLTKSLVVENVRHDARVLPSLTRYVCCVVQYGRRLDADAVRRAVRAETALFASDGRERERERERERGGGNGGTEGKKEEKNTDEGDCDGDVEIEDGAPILTDKNGEAGGARVDVPAASRFNYRLADDCEGVTGYTRNGVTPLALSTRMLVLVDRDVMALDPATIWLGGGQVSLKWRVRLDELRSCLRPIVARISTAAPDERAE